MKKSIVVALSLASCVSCTSTINFRVTELALLEQARTFSGHGSTITVVGLLNAVIESDMELITYAKQHGYNLSYTVTGCSSDIEFSQWSAFYLKELPANDGPYRYDVVFDYKRPPNTITITEVPYNLAKQPEDLCFMVPAANMNLFYHAQSPIVRMPVTDSLIKKLRTFDAQSGPIYFKAADYCEKRLCRPDYSM